MKIKVIDCNYLFSECLIDEAKHDIKQFHQGFILVNDKLYLPYYKVLKDKYTLPDHYETTIIDLDDVTEYDDMSTYFTKTSALDIDDVIDLYDACSIVHLFERLLDTVDEIAQAKYDIGFDDGYDVGNIEGWCECSDSMEE